MKAVHFGAGNIGRGFVGLLLHQAGYELVFADVAEALIQRLADADSYVVHEVGENPRTEEVRGFSALNSATQADALTEAIASLVRFASSFEAPAFFCCTSALRFDFSAATRASVRLMRDSSSF